MKKIPTSFTSYQLNANDTKLGQTLTSLNIAVLQNLLSQLAEEKLNLEFTPNDVLSYTQQEAYLKGQMDVVKFIMAANEEVQSTKEI